MPDVYINSNDTPKPKKKKVAKYEFPKNPEGVPGHTHNPLAAYCYLPHNVSFVDEEPDEKVILLVRRHFITNIGWILLTIVMLFAPLALNSLPLLSFMPVRFQTIAILIWYLLTMAIAIQGFLSWFFSVNIITNKRVIDVDFENLIYRKITDAEISHIEDATVEMSSAIRTILDFGDIIIQTAAEIPEVTFDAVPHPDKIDKILSELRLSEENQ